jgi:predicted GNAT superfamily acetyltransferase
VARARRTLAGATDLLVVSKPARPAAVDEAIAAAERAATAAGVEVRALTELAELDAAAELFSDIWAPASNGPVVSAEMMRALGNAGNYVVGAFDRAGCMAGACVGFFTEPMRRALHSHIAGVVPAAQHRNVGFALKLHQRAWTLSRELPTVTWTFDPLVRRNAYLNLTKLAAVAQEYLPNFYGAMNDRINGSDETDRLLVTWPLTADSVARACAGHAAVADRRSWLSTGARVWLDRGSRAEPVRRPHVGEGCGLVAVPDDIEKLRFADRALAGDWRRAVAEILGGSLAAGARVIGFDRAGWYLVEPPRD